MAGSHPSSKYDTTLIECRRCIRTALLKNPARAAIHIAVSNGIRQPSGE